MSSRRKSGVNAQPSQAPIFEALKKVLMLLPILGLFAWVSGRQYIVTLAHAFQIPAVMVDLTPDLILGRGVYPSLVSPLFDTRGWLAVALTLDAVFVLIAILIFRHTNRTSMPVIARQVIHAAITGSALILFFLVTPNLLGVHGVDHVCHQMIDPCTKRIRPEFLQEVTISDEGRKHLPAEAVAQLDAMARHNKSSKPGEAEGVLVPLQTSDRFFLYFPKLGKSYSVFRTDLLQAPRVVGGVVSEL